MSKDRIWNVAGFNGQEFLVGTPATTEDEAWKWLCATSKHQEGLSDVFIKASDCSSAGKVLKLWQAEEYDAAETAGLFCV